MKNEKVDHEIKTKRDKDLLFGIILIICNIFLIIYAVRISLDAMRIVDCKYYTAPGLPLLIIGVLLIILAVSLIITSLKQGADLKFILPDNLNKMLKEKQLWQTLSVFSYLFIYIFVLWDKIPYTNIHIPFWLSTFIFLNLMMITFKATSIINSIIISLAVANIIDYLFSVLAKVPLP